MWKDYGSADKSEPMLNTNRTGLKIAKKMAKDKLDKPWALIFEKVLEDLSVSPDRGLERNEVRIRRKRFGPNQIKKEEKQSAWIILIRQFKSLIILLLAIASLLSFLFGEFIDAIAIGAAIFINAVFGFVTELRAVRSMEALQKLGGAKAKVIRDGDVQEIAVEELVPGDIAIFEAGDIVPADIRLFEASNLQVDESMLTGESVVVWKGIDKVDENAPLAERSSMLFNGTTITRGSGKGVVAATGMETELGQITTLVQEAEEEVTPLEKRLEKLGHKLLIATLVIAFIVGLVGIITGKELFLMVEMAIALAVAAIPEGLPIVATIALARGMWRMARRNALINRLSAVETLGSTNTIFTDKTGTLTENKMTVTRIAAASEEIEFSDDGQFLKNDKPLDSDTENNIREILKTGVLCNNASYKESNNKEVQAVGDPLEVALLAAGAKIGLNRKEIINKLSEEREEAFSSETMMMATFHRMDSGKYLVAVKGAPDAVVRVCHKFHYLDSDREADDEERKKWLDINQKLAREGLRVLALATKTTDSVDVEPYKELTFLGLVGMEDPPRKEVRESIAMCHKAGIRVIMVTGDQAVTAQNIAFSVGITNDKDAMVVEGQEIKDYESLTDDERKKLLKTQIFSRVTPSQKLNIISLHQKNNSIAAMTGDGVNDAPALKKADIGIAMGQRGTQAAQQASDMVLKDDAFSSIVVAVELGRVIFGNIRKFVVYLLSGNVSEILIVSLALLFNAPLPLFPLQILYLNMLSDVITALALGVGKGEESVMERKPRDPKEPILNRDHWLAIGGYSLIIMASVLGAFALALTWLNMEGHQAVTVSFLTLAFARQWHVFNMRDSGSKFLKNDIVQNPYIWGAIAICTTLLILAVYVPQLASILKLTDPTKNGWIVIISFSFIPWIIGQLRK